MGGIMAARQYRIWFWHGYNEILAAELMAIEGVSRTDKNLMKNPPPHDIIDYIGSLDNFAEQYSRHFIVRYSDNLICVTQYNSFGAR
jgi:hypothetical protein